MDDKDKQADTGDGAPQPDPKPQGGPTPKEVGGRAGPDPTRYGDWENKGIASDF